MVSKFAHIASKKKWLALLLQGLIIGMNISQYALYSVKFCPLHSNISKEQHNKHLGNPSSHYEKHGKFVLEMCAPYLHT